MTIVASDVSTTSYTANVLNRAGASEDPWIGTGDHPKGNLYGEANFAPNGNQELFKALNNHLGAYVFIRNAPTTSATDTKECLTPKATNLNYNFKIVENPGF